MIHVWKLLKLRTKNWWKQQKQQAAATMNCDIIILSKQTLFFTSLVPALILISLFLFLVALLSLKIYLKAFLLTFSISC